MRHIPGLDAIRFLCAMTVAMGHFALRPADDLRFLGRLADPLASAIGLLFNGPAAVIVFFVLSGFVIHRPFAGGRRLVLRDYLTRRYGRIVPPLLAVMLIYRAIGIGPANGDWTDTVLWSVFCELIYYTLYPLILASGVRLLSLTLASFLLTLVLMTDPFGAMGPLDASYATLGHWTWLVGLPCWLSGCVLAEQAVSRRHIGEGEIWRWRAGIYFATIALILAKFHLTWLGPLARYGVSLTLFAPFVALWIGREVGYWSARADGPAPRLDAPGRASFSLYIVHPVALAAIHAVTPHRGFAALALYLAILGVATGAFYLLVERPAHRLAQRLARAPAVRRAIA